MLALHFLCKGADLEDLHPHRLGFPRAILEEPGRRWVALVKSLEGGWLVLFAQVWVETLPGRLRRLDYLACLAWKGRASFLNVEVDGPSHRGREQADRARQGQVALPTVRVPVRALGRVDFPSWLLGECVSAVTFLEQS
ncbi:MAG TPA: hypothetical protein VNO81_00400 [Candidatus Nitrosotenuis sp.]|nr:hypothetical protein [Candidatus Nitrosotenuis sp.]